MVCLIQLDSGQQCITQGKCISNAGGRLSPGIFATDNFGQAIYDREETTNSQRMRGMFFQDQLAKSTNMGHLG
jgi:hypothetical protein